MSDLLPIAKCSITSCRYLVAVLRLPTKPRLIIVVISVELSHRRS